MAFKTVDKLDSIKCKTFRSVRAAVERRKGYVVDQEDVLAGHISDNGVASRISFLNSQNEQ